MTQSASTQTGVSNQSSAKNFLESLLARFPERSRAIFGLRFGLADGQEKTLEEIGHSYGITRERVRQVVDVQLKKMRTELSGKQTHPALQRILVLLNEHHGILTVQQLKTMLAGDDLREGQALLALLALIPGIVVNKETKDEHEYVRVIDFDMKRWHQVIEASMTALKAEGDAVDFARLYAIVSAAFSGEKALDETELKDLLAPTKKIEENVFGRYGLALWSSIRPRGTRERAHLILKFFGKPLHFREIARLIDEHGLYKPGKKTHPQTVHNELIKDKRFVLVGRGTYALSDWGYTRGTVRQVLATILEKHAEPMSREDLLKAVLKVRQVKKSTVIINLNSFFTKVGKNIYTLRDANKNQ